MIYSFNNTFCTSEHSNFRDILTSHSKNQDYCNDKTKGFIKIKRISIMQQQSKNNHFSLVIYKTT